MKIHWGQEIRSNVLLRYNLSDLEVVKDKTRKTSTIMCRNIRPLYNFDPPATPEEVHAAALQFVRKVSGHRQPAKVNKAAFEAAVDDIAGVVERLLGDLESKAPPKNRQAEAAKAQRRRASADSRLT